MKFQLLAAAATLSFTCCAGPSLADPVASVDSTEPSTSFANSKSASLDSAQLAAPLKPAIVTPAVVAPTQTTRTNELETKHSHRIGLPGLFHVNF